MSATVPPMCSMVELPEEITHERNMTIQRPNSTIEDHGEWENPIPLV